MEIPCLRCMEPYEADELRDADPDQDFKTWNGNPLIVLKCPACESIKLPFAERAKFHERVLVAAAMADMCGDDQDSLTVALSDHFSGPLGETNAAE